MRGSGDRHDRFDTLFTALSGGLWTPLRPLPPHPTSTPSDSSLSPFLFLRDFPLISVSSHLAFRCPRPILPPALTVSSSRSISPSNLTVGYFRPLLPFRCCLRRMTVRYYRQLLSFSVPVQPYRPLLLSNIAVQSCRPLLPSAIPPQPCGPLLPSALPVRYPRSILPSDIPVHSYHSYVTFRN